MTDFITVCPLVMPTEGYEADDNVLNLVTFGEEWYSDADEESDADDCSSNASANHPTEEEVYQWLREDILEAIKNDDLQEFLNWFDSYIENPNIVEYFCDYGGRPASSCWEQTNYKYCVCDSEWEEVHRQLEQRKCNCVNGKRWILYNEANEYGAQNIGKYIAESGALDAGYEVWQKVATEAEEEQFYRDAYDAQYAIDELRAKEEKEELEELAFAEYRPMTRGEELELEEEMRIHDREQSRWRIERW